MLEHHDIPLQEIWRRQLQGNEFDISEMSMSFTLQAIPLGWDYRVLPVFHKPHLFLREYDDPPRIGHPAGHTPRT